MPAHLLPPVVTCRIPLPSLVWQYASSTTWFRATQLNRNFVQYGKRPVLRDGNSATVRDLRRQMPSILICHA